MGYCVNLVEANFIIRREFHKEALAALKALGCAKGCRNLADAIEEWGWEVGLDGDYNIVEIDFIGEKMGDEVRFFTALAPFVTPGSFIHMRGEDGEQWKWEFYGHMKTTKARVVWE